MEQVEHVHPYEGRQGEAEAEAAKHAQKLPNKIPDIFKFEGFMRLLGLF